MIVQMAWGGVLPVYLFLGGLGGSALMLAALLDFLGAKRYRRTVRWSAWSAFAFLAAGALLLLAEVGVPLRAVVLWESFVNFRSWLTIGAWVLAAALAFSLVFCVMAQTACAIGVARRVVAALCFILGFATCAYTGALLMASTAVPAWRTWLLPALFVASSLSSGVAYASTAFRLREKRKRAKRMERWSAATVVVSSVEGAILCLYVLWLLTVSDHTMPSAELLLADAFAVPFWVLVVGCGLVVPWLLAIVGLVRRAESKPIAVASTACALAGGVALRFLVLSVGMYVPVTLL